VKCLNNHSVARPIKAKVTWLAGKIKCGCCGYALTAKIYHCKTKSDNRYYLCSNKYHAGGCSFGSLNADKVDEIVFREMQKKLSEFKVLRKQETEKLNLTSLKIRERIAEIETEISSLLDKLTVANTTVAEYINSRISSLDSEKKELYKELSQADSSAKNTAEILSDYFSHWDDLTISEKITVVDIIIEKIVATKEEIQIIWKI